MITPEKAQNISNVEEEEGEEVEGKEVEGEEVEGEEVEEESSSSICSAEMCENWGKELIDHKEVERLESKALTVFFLTKP